MASHSSSYQIPFGAAKLCQDIASLINNRQGSDVQFKVGGGISTQENGETIYDESAAVTFYAHSLILRCRSLYFVTLLDNNNDWKKKSKCIICKPGISQNTFQNVLRYIYTGDVCAKDLDNIIELITVANEMSLEELSTECQSEFIRTVKYIFSNEDESSAKEHISIDVVIHTHIIPALNLASNHSLSNLSQELLAIMLPHISVIIKSPDAYTMFINGISSESLAKIIAPDDLAMTERSVWDLSIDWACCQTKLSKTAIEARLSNLDDDDEEDESSDDKTIISHAQLKQFKKILTPLLPSIRFSLLDFDEYTSMVNTLTYILPRRRYVKINEYFLHLDDTELLDTPRKTPPKRRTYSRMVVESKLVAEPTLWKLLGKIIFETGGISGCHSLNDLKFKRLFRASEHGFLAAAFHQFCDREGPTLVIIKSSDGHLFGGVNYNHWKSDNTYSSSDRNFLFALPDEHHRKDLAIFKIKKALVGHSSANFDQWGPVFGGGKTFDLAIADPGYISYSQLPSCYDGSGASNFALAGSQDFMVSDYEVFTISGW